MLAVFGTVRIVAENWGDARGGEREVRVIENCELPNWELKTKNE